MRTKPSASTQPNGVLSFIRSAVRDEHPYVVGGHAAPPVKLNQNESPFDLPEDLKRALVERIFEIPFNRYPDEHPDRLRAALAEQLGVPEDWMLISNGSNELTYLLGLVLLERGTKVVLPAPLFSLYGKVARLHEADLVEVEPRADLSFDADALIDAVRAHRPALTVIASPNNPTGIAMPLGEIEALVKAAEGFVVIDEAYVEFNTEPSALSLLDEYPNVIILRTFSKASGLAGLRIGYMVARPEVITEFFKARLPFVVDRLAETAALALLAKPDLVADRVAAMKLSTRALFLALQESGVEDVVPSVANFFIFKTHVKPGLLVSRLADAGVLLRNVSSYRQLGGYVRVNAGTPSENTAFLAALEDALRQ